MAPMRLVFVKENATNDSGLPGAGGFHACASA
jgi:hypothetical protein